MEDKLSASHTYVIKTQDKYSNRLYNASKMAKSSSQTSKDKAKEDAGCKTFCRPSRQSNKALTSLTSNIYAKPRMHFTGKGIVQESQSGYSYTLSCRRNKRMKQNAKEDEVKDHLSSLDGEVKNKSDVELKYQDRNVDNYKNCDLNIKREDTTLYSDVSSYDELQITEVENYDDHLNIKTENDFDYDEEDDGCQYEDNINDEDNMSFSNFLNKNMFKRVGHLSESVVECRICYKQMKEASMRQHFKTHSGLKPYPCHHCGARFTRKGDVLRHRKTIHRNIKPFKCVMCEKGFVERKSLIAHLQNHDRMLYFACATCGFKFGKREYFENHIRYIHPLSKDQSISDVKDIVKKGMKQLEQLLTEENSEKDDEEESYVEKEALSDPLCVEKIKKEKEDSDECPFSTGEGGSESIENSHCEKNFESVMDDMHRKEHVEEFEPFTKSSDISVEKGTLSFTQKIQPPSIHGAHEEEEEEELVNKAIRFAVSQSKCALENMLSCVGSNMTSCHLNSISKQATKISDMSSVLINKKSKLKYPEIHITANVGGSLRKFIIHIPYGDIDPASKEGVDSLLSMVNSVCSGKGDVSGPVEIEIRQMS